MAKDSVVLIVESRLSLVVNVETVVLNFLKNKEEMTMARKLRSDCTVGTAEKKLGLPPGTFRNPNGRDTRSDKKIGTIRKENEKKK